MAARNTDVLPQEGAPFPFSLICHEDRGQNSRGQAWGTLPLWWAKRQKKAEPHFGKYQLSQEKFLSRRPALSFVIYGPRGSSPAFPSEKQFHYLNQPCGLGFFRPCAPVIQQDILCK